MTSSATVNGCIVSGVVFILYFFYEIVLLGDLRNVYSE